MQLYRSLIRYCIFPVFSRLYNPYFVGFSSLWEESQYWDRDRIEEHRWSRFEKILAHAAGSVPFYRDYFREHRLTVEDFKDFRDIERLPILSKEVYREHGIESFVSEKSTGKERTRESTSGTSGRPFAFYVDPPLVASKMARLLRENRWAGWEPGDQYIRLWGPHEENLAKKLFYDGAMRRVVISAFTLEQEFDRVEAQFRRLEPKIIEAYTSGAVHLARLCRDNNRSLPAPESIIVSAETLTPQHRSLIEREIGGQVYNRYGSREFGNVAQECEKGGFHIHAESFFLEEEDHAEIPGVKNLVITLFDNYAMPFLRYRIGDLGTLSSEECSCGRNLPLLGRVEGRTTDFFALSSGQLLSFLYFNYFFEQYGGLIDHYQVRQVSPDLLEIRLLAGPRFTTEVPQQIRRRLQESYKDSPRFEVNVVKELLRGASGKIRTYMPLPPEADMPSKVGGRSHSPADCDAS